ncbi:MAG: sialate O-acetylesterase [Mucinivorans sp.]
MKRILLFSLLIFASIVSLNAQVKLASIFTNNMVFQQSAKAPIWGMTMPTTKIQIIASWAPQDTVTAVADNGGRWKATLLTPKADLKSHTIECNNIKISNVMLGEVWIASGQSNMQWNVERGILYGAAEAAKANRPMIRVFQVPLETALTPQEHIDGTWKECTSEIMSSMSAVGYFFASAINEGLKVPVGIISDAWGGTPAEPWIPAQAIERNAKLEGRLAKNVNVWNPILPGRAYNQMIHPFTPLAIAGVVWYQGESNRENAQVYDELMSTLIASWRQAFAQDSPFYFVQIAPFNYGGNTLDAAILRENQERTSLHMPRTAMVVVSDKVNDVNNIHPLDKKSVGQRLATVALVEHYGQNSVCYKSPTLEKATFTRSRAIIHLSQAQGGLVIKGKKAIGMQIAGPDSVFVEADAKILKDNTIEVYAKEVKEPCAVRYCFDDTTIGNIFSATQYPVAPFRTDRKF